LKPIRSSLLSLALAAILVPLSGCGGGTDTDPQPVLDTALSRESLLAPPVGPADVEVASLGFEDAVLDRQILRIDRETHVAVLEALAGSNEGNEDLGLATVIEDLSAEEPLELDGVEVERVSGSIDVEGLIEQIRPLSESQEDGEASGEIPGVGQLNQLEQSLVAADFELFADESDGSLERFDLILALDDPGNSLPPSRIRFSLTQAGEVNPSA
jgi:hypothetical protein